MRLIFIGAGDLTFQTAKLLQERGHEVVIIEKNQEIIDELSDELDCSFIHGDGTKPDILKETGPEKGDVLFCLSENDQDNILGALVGRSLGFERVVPRIHDVQLESICQELGLLDFVNPWRTIGRYLTDISEGHDIIELSTAIRGDARLFYWTVTDKEAKKVEEIDLPEESRVVCYYRKDEFHMAEPQDKLQKGDNVVVLTHSKNLDQLQERYNSNENSEG